MTAPVLPATPERVKVIAEEFDGNWVADAAKTFRQDGDREAWLVFAPHDADPVAALEADNARLREQLEIVERFHGKWAP